MLRELRIDGAARDQVANLVVRLLLHPGIDHLPGGFGVGREVDAVQSATVIIGGQIEKRLLETCIFLCPQRVGDTQLAQRGPGLVRIGRRRCGERFQQLAKGRMQLCGRQRAMQNPGHLLGCLPTGAAIGQGQRRFDA